MRKMRRRSVVSQPINEAGLTPGPELPGTPINCNQIFPYLLTSLSCRSLWTMLCLSACCGVSSVNLVQCFVVIVAVSRFFFF